MAKHRVSSYTHSKPQLNNYANQNNPNNKAYWANQNNHSKQCNPNYNKRLVKCLLSKTEYNYESCQPDD
jgi:hypothetical protein